MDLNDLKEDEKNVIEDKGTEAPFSGKFNDFNECGIYLCRRCNAPLYRSDDKFDSHCGWPSFDDEISGAIKKNVDSDGKRTEIVCNRCDAHLGHVFEGEKLTDKNVRHCVNSVSMDFLNTDEVSKEAILYLGGGCFWCIEAVFEMLDGIQSVTSGFAGGDKDNPTYLEVSSGNTGHAEVVKVVFDQTIISVEKILDVFFDSHDPTTLNRQGNDVGTQYRSAIYTDNEDALSIVRNYVGKMDRKVVTEVKVIDKFYEADISHQDYFKNNGKAPYCQLVIAPKVEKIKKKYLK